VPVSPGGAQSAQHPLRVRSTTRDVRPRPRGEWAFDIPWRVEPPYGKLPVTFVLHHVADPKDPYDSAAADPTDGSTPPVDHVCDMFAVIAPANGAGFPANLHTFPYFPLASLGTHSEDRGFKKIEVSKGESAPIVFCPPAGLPQRDYRSRLGHK
jgi:hypothetical protein